ncbi:MAG: ANTAR domain-containing protein [Clostridia bacterium]|nr:ANTAR domain-containing protein [Clostridia bacterium]
MARIVIVGSSEAGRTQISRLLASSGFDVFRACASGSELRRVLNTCEDGIVILAGAVSDCRPDDLIADFGDSFQFLMIARPESLAACEAPRLFRLTYPCAGSAVLGAVEMLSQFHAQRLPKRTGEDKALVEQAKAHLMRTWGIPEPEAHRRMQQYAMAHGVRMTEYAAQLLKNSEGTEES